MKTLPRDKADTLPAALKANPQLTSEQLHELIGIKKQPDRYLEYTVASFVVVLSLVAGALFGRSLSIPEESLALTREFAVLSMAVTVSVLLLAFLKDLVFFRYEKGALDNFASQTSKDLEALNQMVKETLTTGVFAYART